MTGPMQCSSVPASAGQLMWSHPTLCDKILSHIPRDQQVALMTINNNTFQSVIRWRYDRIYGDVVGHLDFVGTPGARLSQYLSRTISIDLTGCLNAPLRPVLDYFNMCPELDYVTWLDGSMAKSHHNDAGDLVYDVRYRVDFSLFDDEADTVPAHWAYSSQLSRCGLMVDFAQVWRCISIDCEAIELLPITFEEFKSYLLAGPASLFSARTDHYSDFEMVLAAFLNHLHSAEQEWLQRWSTIILTLVEWNDFWGRVELNPIFQDLLKVVRSGSHCVWLTIGSRNTSYWEDACAEWNGNYWHEMSVAGILADTLHLEEPFIPVNALNGDAIPSGPQDYSGRARLRELTYSIRMPISHSDLLEAPALLMQMEKGLAPYADMIARMCGAECELELEAVVEAAEGFDESIVGVDTPARVFWQARMLEMVADARASMLA